MMALADWTLWRPIEAAPKEPLRVIPLSGDVQWTDSFGPELALLCWNHNQPLLIRAAWHTRDGSDGYWRDLDFGDAVDVQILGWVPLPSPEELSAMVEARPR